jgi:hypothetical protein
MRLRLAILALVVVVVSIVAGILAACSEAPTAVAVRTFERAQRMDVVCLKLYDFTKPANPDGTYSVFPDGPHPGRPEECAPVPPGIDGAGLDNQLFALVTQTARGELAAVDLSSGIIHDQRLAVPGINFIPVGAFPTDVATTPDGVMAFVGAAEPNKAAIYGVPTYTVVGDAQRFNSKSITLPNLPVCALPQNPGALTVVQRRAAPAGTTDAGATDAGADGGTDAGPPAQDKIDYELVVVLPGDRRSTAKVITIDPRPFIRAIAVDNPGRTIERNMLELADGPTLAPGGGGAATLPPCPITSAIELVGGEVVPKSFTPGPKWPDGVPYVDGGVDLSCDTPLPPATCEPTCCPGVDASAEAGTCTPPGEEDGGPIDITHGPLDPPRLLHAVRDDQTLYVADASLPIIHVVDLSTQGAPKELKPFIATSISDPSRTIAIRDLAVSPPTRDFKRFLYAIDRDPGSLIAWDVTDPNTTQRTPMRRPHPELNPFQPEDRISFSTPAVAVSFARHDFPLSFHGAVPNAASGILCNANPVLNANPADPTQGTNGKDIGFYYRNDRTEPDVALGPRRLRGIFAFATLANGSVIAIDVDDWDAPCRRPRELSTPPNANAPVGDAGPAVIPPPGDLAIPQTSLGPDDFDPYHAPQTDSNATSEEITFPISVPHRIRPDSFLKNDSTTGNHVPALNGRPTLTANGAPFLFQGPGSEKTPLLLPPNVARPAEVAGVQLAVQFSVEAPEVHIDQDWQLNYEGVIPGFDGLSAGVDTLDAHQSLVLTQPNGRFCSKGVEDFTMGAERGRRTAAAVASDALQRTQPTTSSLFALDRRIADYVQLTEDLLPIEDNYWGATEPANDACWPPTSVVPPDGRWDFCNRTFGAAADQNPSRDFPIVEAFDDHLVITRYAPNAAGREVVAPDPSNATMLAQMRCCFHRQVKFKVRTGGVWSIVGFNPGTTNVGVGFLSGLTVGADKRCGPSCDPRDAFLVSRTAAVPSVFVGPPGRDSPLAMRNPMFSLWVSNGANHVSTVPDSTDPTGQKTIPIDVFPVRDTNYTIRTKGQLNSLVINLAASTIAVNPQSMRFIETLGQIAVVDAASQGLVLIDLGGVAVAHAPYF